MSESYWSEESYVRPNFVSDSVWQKIYANFLSEISDPVQDLPTALVNNMAVLQNMGIASPTDYQALQFELDQAADFGSIAEREASGVLGQGWTSLADIKLVGNSTGELIIEGLMDAGALSSLDVNQVSQYAVSLSLGRVLNQNGYFTAADTYVRPGFNLDQNIGSDSGYTIRTVATGHEVVSANGDKYVFDADGALTTFVSASGDTITVSYDVNDRISKYEDANGRYVEFTYDANGKLISAADHNGLTVDYTYDTNGRLETVTDEAGHADYIYDTNGYLLTAQRDGGTGIEFTCFFEGGRVA